MVSNASSFSLGPEASRLCPPPTRMVQHMGSLFHLTCSWRWRAKNRCKSTNHAAKNGKCQCIDDPLTGVVDHTLEVISHPQFGEGSGYRVEDLKFVPVLPLNDERRRRSLLSASFLLSGPRTQGRGLARYGKGSGSGDPVSCWHPGHEVVFLKSCTAARTCIDDHTPIYLVERTRPIPTSGGDGTAISADDSRRLAMVV